MFDDRMRDDAGRRDQRKAALERVAYVGTWRFRVELLTASVMLCGLTLAAICVAVVNGLWLAGLGAAVCWSVAGVLGLRLWHRLGRADNNQVHAVRRAKCLLAGLGLFLAGALIIALAA
jgi:hypothetical protein